MIDIALEYGLFLAKAVTVVLAIVAGLGGLAAILANLARRESRREHLEVKHLNRRYESLKRALEAKLLPTKGFKAEEKRRKKAAKRRAKGVEAPARRRVFVIDFQGDIRASAVSALREEITAILTMATPGDEVVVRLTNSGGLVHEHGLAASQLLRLRAKGIPITAAVDKIAASGGYLMACVANRIVAAPFAVLGSIGVLLQLPNFNRLLDSHGVDFEMIKGGEFKRTLTLFGKNTDADRAKTRQDVEETHALFKRFVQEQRPSLDIARVATGEHWYGRRALELELCDELKTSDEYLLDAADAAEIYQLAYTTKKPLSRRLAASLRTLAASIHGLWWQRHNDERFSVS